MDKETDQYRDYLQRNQNADYDNNGVFKVVGAGNIQISNSAEWSCGKVTGFSVGVEWGRYGYAGGVLSREEAIRLVEHIQRHLIPNE